MRQTAVTLRDALSKAIASKLISLDHAIAREGAVTAKPLEVFFESVINTLNLSIKENAGLADIKNIRGCAERYVKIQPRGKACHSKTDRTAFTALFGVFSFPSNELRQ